MPTTDSGDERIDPVQIDQTRALTEGVAKLIDPGAFVTTLSAEEARVNELRRTAASQRALEVIAFIGQNLK